MDFAVDEFGRQIAGPRREDNDEDSSRGSSPANPVLRQNALDESDDSDAFSDDVVVVDGEEATEDITKPLVAAADDRGAFHSALMLEDRRGEPTVSDAAHRTTKAFVNMLATIPQRLKSFVVIGALHHGKTSFIEMLCTREGCPAVPVVQRRDEKRRRVTLRTSTMTAVLGSDEVPSSCRSAPSSLVTLIDTPGHPSLAAEVAAGVRLADAAILCVDAAEGVLEHTRRLIGSAALEGLPFFLVLTKVDRLLLDLRLPPIESYRKLRGIVDAVNNVISSCGSKAFVSPACSTVIFVSTKLQLCFSLESFGARYLAEHPCGPNVAPSNIAKKLWGGITFDEASSSFVRLTSAHQRPSFVTFVLEPIYKVIALSITGKGATLLIHEALPSASRSPIDAARAAVSLYCGSGHGEAVGALLNVSPAVGKQCRTLTERICPGASESLGCLVVSPMCRTHSDKTTYAALRVIKGTLVQSRSLVVIDEKAGADEPYFVGAWTALYVKTTSGLVAVSEAHEGQVVYAEGPIVDKISGNAVMFQTIDGVVDDQRQDCFEALNAIDVLPIHADPPLVHLSIEPLEPKSIVKMRVAMQSLLRTSPGLDIRAEETGEYTVVGSGEFHLDTVLHDLRAVIFHQAGIKASAPFVSFRETVASRRGVLSLVGEKGHTQVGMVAGSLDPEVAERFERGSFSLEEGGCTPPPFWSILHKEHHWDLLDARNVVSVGPSTRGSNVLINDIVETDEIELVGSGHLPAVVQGFQNAMKNGPLCGEPVRQVKSSLVHLSVASGQGNSSSQHLALSSRLSVWQSLFGARMRLMEPVYAVEMIAVPWRMEAITEILRMRRGSILSETPVPATSLNVVKAYMPIMDSFGFETQLRMTTVGEVFCTMTFDHWDVVPGDPLDAACQVPSLEPARGFQIARDFVVKTRFRKGLTTEIVVPQ